MRVIIDKGELIASIASDSLRTPFPRKAEPTLLQRFDSSKNTVPALYSYIKIAKPAET
jgi:hypothetical protein